MDNTKDTYAVAPAEEHTHTVIFLHSRDSTAAEFTDEFFELSVDYRTLSEIFPNFKWVFPSGLLISVRFETDLSQWFDTWSVEEPEGWKELQIDGLKESIALILDVVYSEPSLVPPEYIIPGGINSCFSALPYSARRIYWVLWLAPI